jgi:hypothetical protein
MWRVFLRLLPDHIDIVHACSNWRGDWMGPVAVMDAVAKRDIPTPAENRTLVTFQEAGIAYLMHFCENLTFKETDPLADTMSTK